MTGSNQTPILLLMALGGACAYSPSTAGDDEVTNASTHALTTPAAVSGFETLSAWSATSATLALTTEHVVEGASALDVRDIEGYATLVSDVTSGPGPVDSSITLQIRPPPGHDQAPWKGFVQLSVHSPSRSLYSTYVGQGELTGLSAGAFGTVSISVPPGVRAALSSGSNDDVRYTLALNVPLPGPYLLDAMKLGSPVLDPTPTPTPVAHTGGTDIAVLWEPIVWSSPTLRYDVYRDGQLVGTARPSIYALKPSSATYIDADVVANQTYSYEVQAVASNGTRAARSAPVSITHSTEGTPVPAITVDDGGYPHTLPYLELGKRYLQTWYPKIANILAYPVYQPPSAITLRAVREIPNNQVDECLGAGWVDIPGHGNVVFICAYDNLGSSDDVGLFVHEATHLMQGYSGAQLPAAGEGIASWAGNLATGLDNKLASPPLGSYFDNYEYGSYFFEWIARTYDKPSFIRDLHLVCRDGTYSNAWLATYTGQTLGQMFGTMTETKYTSPGPLRLYTGQYAYPSDTKLTAGSKIVLKGSPSNPGRFFQGPISGTAGPLRWEKNTCAVEDAQGFVVVQSCSSGSPTLWSYAPAVSSFRSETTGRCLQPQGGSLVSNTPLVTTPCVNAATQRWQRLPL